MSFLATTLIAIVASVTTFFGGMYMSQDGVGAISFPTSIDTLTNPSATDSTATVSHSVQHSDANDAIEALEAKVGADSSAVTTSHDYKLSNVTGSDKAVSLTGSETLTNKILTSPTVNSGTLSTSTLATTTLTGSTTINIGSDATGDIFYRDSNGEFQRLAIGTNGQQMVVSGGIPNWQTFSISGIKVRAYVDGDQSIGAASTTKVVFDDESFDTGSDFSTTTGEFTAPATAYYYISSTLLVDINDDRDVYIKVNGTNVRKATGARFDSSSIGPIVVTDILSLTAGDVVRVDINITAGGTVMGDATTPESVLTIFQL
jgi:hypothetical protein